VLARPAVSGKERSRTPESRPHPVWRLWPTTQSAAAAPRGPQRATTGFHRSNHRQRRCALGQPPSGHKTYHQRPARHSHSGDGLVRPSWFDKIAQMPRASRNLPRPAAPSLQRCADTLTVTVTRPPRVPHEQRSPGRRLGVPVGLSAATTVLDGHNHRLRRPLVWNSSAKKSWRPPAGSSRAAANGSSTITRPICRVRCADSSAAKQRLQASHASHAEQNA
jgi:hypothetical protein